MSDAFRLQRIGFRGLQCPIAVLDRAHGRQRTIARVDMHVEMPHDIGPGAEGRLTEIIGRRRDEVDVESIGGILWEMKSAFSAESAHVEFAFPYFITKTAPVSGAESVMDYECRIIGRDDGVLTREVEVRVPVTLLHPHDGAGRGSRNQRCVVTMRVAFTQMVWIEELVALCERHASSQLYSLLKRSDEQFVTVHAYENAVTPAELVERVAGELAALKDVRGFSLNAENLDTVRNHNSYAAVSWKRPDGDS